MTICLYTYDYMTMCIYIYVYSYIHIYDYDSNKKSFVQLEFATSFFGNIKLQERLLVSNTCLE